MLQNLKFYYVFAVELNTHIINTFKNLSRYMKFLKYKKFCRILENQTR